MKTDPVCRHLHRPKIGPENCGFLISALITALSPFAVLRQSLVLGLFFFNIVGKHQVC